MDQGTQTAIVSLLQTLNAVLADSTPAVDFLRVVLEQSVERTGASRGVLVEVPATGDPQYPVLHRLRPEGLNGDPSGRYRRGIFAKVIATGRNECIDDAAQHAASFGQEPIAQPGFCSVACVALRAGGRVSALVHLEHDDAAHFTGFHRELLEDLAEIAGPMLEAIQAGHRLRSEQDQLHRSARSLRVEAQESRHRFKHDWSFQRFVGRSEAVRKLESEVVRAAAYDFPVLLLGETGTGKSLLARILHAASPRASGPFVTVACPNLAGGMMEAELFGTRDGAYTDAKERVGKIQVAEGGTLFLDEIGDLSLELQPKLLRLLQEKTYEVLGDPHEHQANVRIIAATNQDLEQRMQIGAFRSDLYHRLDYLRIHVPPLRAHKEDIPILLRYCLDRVAGGRWFQVEDDALDILKRVDFLWPGNFRALEKLAATIVVENDHCVVTCADIERFFRLSPAPAAAEKTVPRDKAGAEDLNLPRFLLAQEKKMLQSFVETYKHLARAEQTRRLGISEATYFRKLRQHGLMD